MTQYKICAKEALLGLKSTDTTYSLLGTRGGGVAGGGGGGDP